MELRHLRYFVAVAEELNFRRAAERLGVAHPSLSKQIQDLEYELKVQLLDRDTSGVRLTNAGGVFLESARAVLHEAAQAVALAREAAAGQRGRLVVGNVAPLSASFIPASIVAFREKHPEVEVALQDIELPDQMSCLEDGSLHVAFTMEPETALPAHLEHLLVLRSPVCAVLGAGHRLAAKARIKPEDAVGETVVCLGAHTRFPGHAERTMAAFAARGLRPPRIKRVGTFESLHALVASRQGITFLPKLLARRQPAGIVIRPVSDLGANAFFELRALWHKQSPSPLVRQFVEVLKQVRPAAQSGRRSS